jgi:hypothetical protein
MDTAIETLQEDQDLQKVAPLDELEVEMFKHPQVHCPLIHRFTPGMYIREILMPAGTVVTTATHKTEHPFVVSKGECSVWRDGFPVERIKAPHTGITKPGTRRLIYIHEDTVWITFHVTDKTDPDEIAKDIADLEPNPLLSAEDLLRSAWQKDWKGEVESPEQIQHAYETPTNSQLCH